MFSVQTPALQSWHHGELAIQSQLKFTPYVRDAYVIIASSLPNQHRLFHSNNISFLPLASTSPVDGRVWASIICGESGEHGFIFSPDENTLIVLGDTWDGEPLRENWKAVERDGETLVAAVGVELTSRRRNKFAGKVKRAVWSADLSKVGIEIKVNQAIGNCPKYITLRETTPSPSSPKISSSNMHLSSSDTLPPQVIQHIKKSDTIFLATVFTPTPDELPSHPPHLGCNHRGGPSGFLRISPSKPRTIYLPDYSGNRLMTSLGNIETDERVGICIPDFDTGDILYLTGTARNLVGEEAEKVMRRVKCVTEMVITGYTLVLDALPLRHSPNSPEEKSPYTPPIRYLVEEEADLVQLSSTARLVRHELVGKDLVRLTFEIEGEGEGLKGWKAGQYAVLDTTSLVGEMEYKHMERGDEKAVNEDGVRTWTISSPPPSPKTTKPTLSITIRHHPRGRATSRFFSLLSPSRLVPFPSPSISLPLLGIGGSFLLPADPSTPIIGVAGGIGITPYLSFLGQMARRGQGKMTLVVATREVEVMWKLVGDALSIEEEPEVKGTVEVDAHFFDSASPLHGTSPALSPPFNLPSYVKLRPHHHSGRLDPKFFTESQVVQAGAKAFVCGPNKFEDAVLVGLTEAGLREDDVGRENFDY